MAVFQINLGRGRIIPVRKRRAWYRGLLLYLAFSGLLLTIMAGSVTTSLIRAFDRRLQLTLRERKALLLYPGNENIEEYAAGAGIRIAHYADKLESLAGVIRQNQPRIAIILSGLASPLSGDMAITSLDLNTDKSEISFEIWVPEDGTTAGINPPGLVSEWNRLPALMAEVPNLASTGKQNTHMNGRKFSAWRFTGRLRQNGA
ncbi:MAG: hypothetical protein WCL44_06280 [bacterium]